MVAQIVKKLLAFHETQKFITAPLSTFNWDAHTAQNLLCTLYTANNWFLMNALMQGQTETSGHPGQANNLVRLQTNIL
jgi:hypothetical protein